VLQWPLDDKGEPKKHWVVPAWFVSMAGESENETVVNMRITWERVTIDELTVNVPVLVNTRAVKDGDILKRPFIARAAEPPAKKRRGD